MHYMLICNFYLVCDTEILILSILVDIYGLSFVTNL